MSKMKSSGKSGQIGGTLALAMSIFRPTQKADRSRVKAGADLSRNMRSASPQLSRAMPECRPLSAAELNEAEHLSSLRSALYPKD